MKKLLVLFFALFAIFSLTSCDKHKHYFAREWKYNETMHWRECECGEKEREEEHTGGSATETKKATCKVCGQPYGDVLNSVTPDDPTTPENNPSEGGGETDETYTVTYNVNGHGTAPSALTNVTALPAELPVLTEEGYIFEGWYLEETCTTAATAGATISADTTLYAKWSQAVATYTVTFNTLGHGKTVPEALTNATALPTELPVLTAASFTFEGWYLEETCTTAAIAGATISANTTLYAKWTLNVDLSGIKFEDDEVEFDGAKHSIKVTGLPEGLTAEYSGNDQSAKGEYTITATIKDADGESLTTLEATLKITEAKDDGTYPYLKSIGIDPTEVHNAYQLQVYSFYDSDGDGYGDLKGVEKLDYIEYLDVDIIWLSPIMSAVSYHGYDITSFYSIDPKLGTIADYKSLVNEAHERGIKIILDMPINHTSPEHEWFKGFLSGDPQYAEYYQERQPGVIYGNGGMGTFYDDEESGKSYFAAFGKTMPDLNFQSAELREGVQDVFEYWVELGADGFRLDAIKHIYDPNEIPSNQNAIELNNQYWSELRSYLKGINPNIYLVGENFSGQQEVKQYAKSFDAEFDFEGWHTALGAVANGSPWGRSGEDCRKYYDDTIIGCTNELLGENPDWIPSFMTGNHDVTRAASYIWDSVTDGDAAIKLYAALSTLRAGIPYIYAGDELGMYGKNLYDNMGVKDGELRLPIPFRDTTVDVETVLYTIMEDANGNEIGMLGTNLKNNWPTFATTCTYDSTTPYVEDKIEYANSILNVYKGLLELRREYPALAIGSMSAVADYNACATIIGFTYNGETIYVAFNYSEQATTLSGVCDGTIELIHTVNGATVSGTDLQMSGRGVAVFTATGTMGSGNSVTFADTYYLLGSMNGWAPVEEYKFIPNPGNSAEVMLTIALNAGDEFKVVKVNGTNYDWNGHDRVKNQDAVEWADGGNIKIKESRTYNLYWNPNEGLWIG